MQSCQSDVSCASRNLGHPQMSAAGDLLSAVAGSSCLSPWNLLIHALTNGTTMLVIGVISGVTCAIPVHKSHSKLRSDKDEVSHVERATDSEETDLQTARNNFLPMESMGLPYSSYSLLSALGSMLKKAAPIMLHLVESVNESLLTISVCLPVGLYYFTRITLARLNPQVGDRQMTVNCMKI